jgi:hypothetical protein
MNRTFVSKFTNAAQNVMRKILTHPRYALVRTIAFYNALRAEQHGNHHALSQAGRCSKLADCAVSWVKSMRTFDDKELPQET